MSAPKVQIGILTIRDDEFKAVLRAFPHGHQIHRGRHREYTLRTADAGRGKTYQIAILKQIEQGNGEAQEAARDLIDDLQPSLLLVVGIAGGLPSDDVTLGDVVLSTRIHDFSVEARKFAEATTYNVGGGPIAKSIAAGLANLGAREADLGDWWADLPPKPKISTSAKNLYGPKAWKGAVKAKLEAHFGADAKERPPLFAAGPIASSDRLVKDPRVLFPWITTARQMLAVEMESAGVHRASRDRTPMVAIRGLSDLVGFKRHDAWTKYACQSAANFSAAYLRTTPVPAAESADSMLKEPDSAPTVNESESSLATEEAFSNLLPLRYFPEDLYISAALCSSMRDGWARIRKGSPDQHVSGAWTLHEGNIYSVNDPEASKLRRIVDIGAIDKFELKSWAYSADANKKRLFVYLLNAALKEDLWAHGVRYFGDQEVFAFSGWPDDPKRTLKYANLKLRSTATVVAHYESISKDGKKKYKYLRHNAFQGRFRFLAGQYFLEITPTYRFTYDGKNLDRFHESRLSGIKRIERNRSVLSQLLIWQAVLRAPWTHSDRPRLLEFAPLQSFKFSTTVDETTLTAIDPPVVTATDDKEVD